MIAIGALLVILVLDGGFSGMRASLGRTGLIHHRRHDLRAGLIGAMLLLVLAVPAALLAVVDVTWLGGSTRVYAAGAAEFLLLSGPFAVIVLIAMATYVSLSWQLRYLAAAVVMGPLTLFRPIAVGLAAAWVCCGSPAAIPALLLAWVVLAALSIERLMSTRQLLNISAPRSIS